MRKTSFLIVDSPFQLLCGVEYILVNNIKPVKLIIVNNRVENELQINQINNIYLSYKELFISKDIYNIDKTGLFSFYSFLSSYNKVARSINSYSVENIIIGDYANCYFRHLANVLNSKRVVVLDDGFRTIKTVTSIVRNSLEPKEYVKKVLSLFSYEPEYNSDVTLFTIFSDYVDFKNKEENSFSNIKDDLRNVPLVKELHFIGSPLVEDGIVDKDTYFRYLGNICDKYALDGITIKYIPHRREDSKKILSLTEKHNLHVNNIDQTIELYELNNDSLPEYVLSFFSTALFNLKKILPSKVNIRYIKLSSKEILERKSHIENIYDILKKELLKEDLFDVKK